MGLNAGSVSLLRQPHGPDRTNEVPCLMKNLAVVALLAFCAAACGGSSGGDARVDDVVAWLEEESALDDVQLTVSENRCLAGEIVASLDDDLLDALLAGNPGDDPPIGTELILIDADTLETMMTSELTGTDPSPEEEEALMAVVFEVMFTCGGFDE